MVEVKQRWREEQNLGVKHDGAEDACILHGSAKVVEGLLMVLVGAVGEIETGYVHAGAEKLLNHGNGATSGTESADDLGLGPAFG